MNVTNVGFYFALMALCAAVAAVLGRVLPSERAHLLEDQSGRLLTLDGLRGVLAPSVFLHHALSYFYFAGSGRWIEAPSNFYAQMGVLPVTLFFFITGYLFWTKLMKRQKLGFVEFMKDRLRRLGGAYWFACLLLFGFIAVESGFVRQVSWGRLFLEALGWFSFLGAGHDMNHLFDSKRLLGQVWTLRMEWMFYLSLPFFGWFARRRTRLGLLLTGALMLSVLVGYVDLRFSGAANFLWKMAGNYAHYLVVTFSGGMIVAAVPVSDAVKRWARSVPATVISCSLLLITVLIVPAEYGVRETGLLILPFACICWGNTGFGLLVSRPLRTLGRVSYSFYLLHVFVLQTGFAILSRSVSIASLNAWEYWGFVAVCATGAIVLSYASYQFLERPFLTHTRTATFVPPSVDSPVVYEASFGLRDGVSR